MQPPGRAGAAHVSGPAVGGDEYFAGVHVLSSTQPERLKASESPKKGSTMNTTIKTEIPAALARQARSLVKSGWAANLDSLVSDALRRYLESHRAQLTEAFVREDVQWGLHGKD